MPGINIPDTIYTHDEAAEIIDTFESILDRYNIVIPSPEDDERDWDTTAPLYGSVYSELLDEIESMLVTLVMRASTKPAVIMNQFSGDI